MKTTIDTTTKKTIDIAYVRVRLPVDFGEEDIPNNFPMRRGKVWEATIDIDNGTIVDWTGGSGLLCMKVCDGGTYTLLDRTGKKIKSLIGEYVPHGLIPGEYGDVVRLEIESGTFTLGVFSGKDLHPARMTRIPQSK